MHFENRYWNIDQLMQSLDITNILELSSGFSFRGLALSREKQVFYLDTDLPELIATKQQLVSALAAITEPAVNPGTVATNSSATNSPATNSRDTIAPAPNTLENPAPVTNGAHQPELTAQIAPENPAAATSGTNQPKPTAETEAAAAPNAAKFFTGMGFIVDREATTDLSQLSAWPRLLASLTPETQKKLAQTPKIHAVWRLRVAET